VTLARPRAAVSARRLQEPFARLNWPRVVLLLLLLGYWFFVSRLERVDGNLVWAALRFPDLSPTQIPGDTFPRWLTLLAELFHPRVLRHVIPIIVGWQLAVQATISLMQVLYDCPDRKTAADFLRRQRRDRVSRLELPYTVLPHTLDQAREESILLRVGGPVPVVIPNGYAAVTERNARFMRVLPPGYHILGRFEYLLGVVDLQPQTRTANEVTMLTKEGIPVKTDIGLTFSIDPGDEPSPLRPYPFDPEAVRRAAYAGAVGANDKVSSWDDAPLGKVRSALSAWVADHPLDELLADMNHDAHYLMTGEIINKVWPKDGEGRLIIKDGIRPLRFHVGHLTPADEISNQYIEYWLSAQQREDKLAQAKDTARLAQDLEATRIEGHMLIIQALVEGLRQAQQDAGSRVSGYILALSLVEALRQMFNMSAHEAQAVNESTNRLEEEFAAVSQRLAGLQDSLERPTVALNPSRPE
jgi:hypothetical protein